MLIKAYVKFQDDGEKPEPEDVLVAKKDWVAQEKSVIETFLKNYEITNNPEHSVYSYAIDSWIKSEKLGISMKKFGLEMKRYCKIKKYDNVFSEGKKQDGKNVKAWFGVREIPEPAQENTPDIV